MKLSHRTKSNITGFVIGIILFLLFFVTLVPEAKAWEDKKKKGPTPKLEMSQRQLQDMQNRQLNRQESNLQNQVTTGAVNTEVTTGPVSTEVTVGPATGGAATINGGDYVSEYTFYAYEQSNRPATGCFVSADGAGGNDGKFGALGFYWLDHNCWADKLAADERDVDLNARLKCYGRKYRNAIAYDVKGRRARQDYCVSRVRESGLARIEQERKAMQAEIDRTREELEKTAEENRKMTDEIELSRLQQATTK